MKNRRGPYKKSEETRTRILEACIRCVVESGFEGASLSRFGKEAGVDPALIFHYFGSKEGLIRAMVEHNGMIGKLATDHFMAENAADIEDPVERYVRATFAWLRKSPAHAGFFIFILLRASYDPYFNKFVWKHFEGARLRVEGLLRERMPEARAAEIPGLAAELHGSLLGNLVLAHAEGAVRLDHYERQAINSMNRQLGAAVSIVG